MKFPRPFLTIACVLALGAVTAWANSVSTPNIPVVGPVLNGDLLLGTRSGVTYNMSWPPASALTASTFLGSTTSSNPSINGDATTGLYTPGAAQVGVVVSGTAKATWGATRTYGYNPVTIDLNALALNNTLTGAVLQLGNTTSTPTRIESDVFGASAYFSSNRADGTLASPTAIQSGEEIGGVNAFGYNGAATVGPAASVREYAAANWTTTSNPTYVDIGATPTSSTTMAEVARFYGDGGVVLPSTVTGGDEGAGTLNAAGLYVNGVAVSTADSVNIANTTSNATYYLGFVTTTTGTLSTLYGTAADLTFNPTMGLTNAAATVLSGTTTISGALNATATANMANVNITGGNALLTTATVGTLNVTTCTGCGSAAKISSLLGSTTTNTIDNANWAQAWTWNTLTTQTGLSLTSSSGTSGSVFAASLTTSGNSGSAANFSNTATGTTGYAVLANGRIQNANAANSNIIYIDSNSNSNPICCGPVFYEKVDSTHYIYMNQYTGASFRSLVNGVGAYGASGAMALSADLASGGTTQITFALNNWTEGMRLSSNGLNIGITSGNDRLDVGGGIGLVTTTATVPTNGFYLPSANTLSATVSGSQALLLNSTGNDSTAVGYQALTAVTTGTNNVAYGYQSGSKITTGGSNVIVGALVASTTLTTGSGNILIGEGTAIDTAATSTSNTLNIGGVITGTGINTASTSTITIPGALSVTGTGTFGGIVSDGTGQLVDACNAGLSKSGGTCSLATTGASNVPFKGSAGTPTCGTGCSSITSGSTDGRGSMVSSSSVSSITLNFSTTLSYTPFCVISDSNSSAVADISSITTSALTVSLASALSAVTIYWHCDQ